MVALVALGVLVATVARATRVAGFADLALASHLAATVDFADLAGAAPFWLVALGVLVFLLFVENICVPLTSGIYPSP